jgi:histidine triad (HIT) family protein
VSSTPKYEDDCVFCAIALGTERPSELLCAFDSWLAFLPLEPATPGHTLVIPRTHVSDLWALPDELQPQLMAAIVDVGRAIQRALSPQGMNLITSAGAAAEQTILHLHLHLVPRWVEDGFGRIWPTEGRYETGEPPDVAERIRAELRTVNDVSRS